MSHKKIYTGSLTTIILKLLSEEGRMYGYEITQKVKELTRGEMKITEGALYPALHKLEEKGMLQVEMVRIDNRLRKYYKLSKTGRKESVDIINEFKAMLDVLQNLISSKPDPA